MIFSKVKKRHLKNIEHFAQSVGVEKYYGMKCWPKSEFWNYDKFCNWAKSGIFTMAKIETEFQSCGIKNLLGFTSLRKKIGKPIKTEL